MATENQTQTGSSQNTALKLITPAVAVLIIAGVAMWMNNKPAAEAPADSNPDTNSEQTTPNSENTDQQTPSASYKTGSYAVTGSYQSPAGPEELGVTISLDQNGIIQEAKTETLATNPASKKWQDTFAAGFSTEVIGKSIDEVSLDIVNGSSLTPKGFNDALQKIKTQAMQS